MVRREMVDKKGLPGDVADKLQVGSSSSSSSSSSSDGCDAADMFQVFVDPKYAGGFQAGDVAYCCCCCCRRCCCCCQQSKQALRQPSSRSCVRTPACRPMRLRAKPSRSSV